MQRRAALCLLPGLATPRWGLASIDAQPAEELPLYSYQTEASFAALTPQGLTGRLARWLGELSGGRYRFIPTQLPRPRLDRMLAEEAACPGVLAWTHPNWIGDPQRRRFHWSGTLLHDLKLAVSHRAQPVDYGGAASLYGLRLGTVRGHRYGPLGAAMADGRIFHEDVSDEEANLSKLKRRRIDVTFISAVALLRLRRLEPDCERWLHVSRLAPVHNERHLCCQRQDPALATLLDRAAAAFAESPQWRPLRQQLQALARRQV